ncbi:uncharacterized protein LDX57_005571 [Aspergillus melleus]|uniref:uncharacterized protein n=1 Tax=Aspergillus melleus TaxID=138277 RepID=UPI001E8CEDF4|nr:uncharacterized protein LDX57_005571 [Aspergillus melleus]KAH8427866.1 hypothetical protein LDX57_005571 [Aspergillus melleus]
MSVSPKTLEEAKPAPQVSETYGYGDTKSIELGTQNDVNTETQRGLSSRQLQLIAMGGCIGTGLFVGAGSTLSLVGPAPLSMSYAVMALIVWLVMNVLGEMTTYLPVKGISVPYLIGRFTEPSIGFAAGESGNPNFVIAGNEFY